MSLNHPEGSKKDLLKKYAAMKLESPPVSRCAGCGGWFSTALMEPHHPAGRKGTNILRFIWLDQFCRRLAHHAPKAATEEGLLWKHRNTRSITDSEWEELKQRMPYQP